MSCNDMTVTIMTVIKLKIKVKEIESIIFDSNTKSSICLFSIKSFI